jgi:hypothetical protein
MRRFVTSYDEANKTEEKNSEVRDARPDQNDGKKGVKLRR